jgi:hypothetical protein
MTESQPGSDHNQIPRVKQGFQSWGNWKLTQKTKRGDDIEMAASNGSGIENDAQRPINTGSFSQPEGQTARNIRA